MFAIDIFDFVKFATNYNYLRLLVMFSKNK